MVSTAVRTFARGIPWNLFLLTLGCGLFALGVKAIAIPHMLISGGVFGTALLINYMTETLSPAVWNVLLNIPIFIAGWLFVGRRFVLYSLYGLAVVSVATQYLDMTINITDPILASIAAGCICGLGLGIVLHSIGCDGGLTIIPSPCTSGMASASGNSACCTTSRCLYWPFPCIIRTACCIR